MAWFVDDWNHFKTLVTREQRAAFLATLSPSSLRFISYQYRLKVSDAGRYYTRGELAERILAAVERAQTG